MNVWFVLFRYAIWGIINDNKCDNTYYLETITEGKNNETVIE